MTLTNEQIQALKAPFLKTILSLLAERESDKALIAELEKKHCGGSLMEREEHHVGVVNKLLERITELEARAITVKLPEPLMPAQHNSGELFMTPDNIEQGGYLNRDDVLRALRKACAAAGITLDVGG